MLFKKQKQINELEQRCMTLARANKQFENTIDELKNQIEDRNYFIKEQNERLNRKQNSIKEILELIECNTYNNEKAFLDKVKELAQTTIKY